MTEPLLVDLDSDASLSPALCGAKAANLARARRSGLPTQPGFVLTTAATGTLPASSSRLGDVLRTPWSRLSAGGTVPLVVRSSSVAEDATTSSLAGRFRSVLDVRGWEAFTTAVDAVVASAASTTPPAPMAVLVQPMLAPRCGGVLFGLDPVTGRSDHIVVEAISGRPDSLVSGARVAEHYVLARSGRLLLLDHQRGVRHRRRRPLLPGRQRRRLAALCRRTEKVFGGPQDVEWAIDGSGTLWLLQSRPVTAAGPGAVHGPVLGPGPVAEMFPDPLRPLEAEMWVEPLRQGVSEALLTTHVVPSDQVLRSPVVTTVQGRVAADLSLFGYVGRPKVGWRLLDPRVGGRRLRAAWRVGWLRTALPARVRHLVADVDARLARVPPLATLDDSDLVDLLVAAAPLLVALHRDEVLVGALLPARTGSVAAVALGVLDEARGIGLEDAETCRRSPVVLALVPPRVAEPLALPRTVHGSVLGRAPAGTTVGAREALRLRARWVQELTARAGWALGERWSASSRLPRAQDVALLTVTETRQMADGADAPDDLPARRQRAETGQASAPLPAQFQLSEGGDVVPRSRPALGRAGVAAGGGRGAGPVCHGTPAHPPVPGDVLVVRTLDPTYAPWLPGLAGLVAETGSTLSHLAILARELGVPTVVAVPDALQRFPGGLRVVVDGVSGAVEQLPVEEAVP